MSRYGFTHAQATVRQERDWHVRRNAPNLHNGYPIMSDFLPVTARTVTGFYEFEESPHRKGRMNALKIIEIFRAKTGGVMLKITHMDNIALNGIHTGTECLKSLCGNQAYLEERAFESDRLCCYEGKYGEGCFDYSSTSEHDLRWVACQLGITVREVR